MFNQVILIGRLTRDVETRTTPNNKVVANVSLVTSEKFKDSSGQIKEQAEFHNLVIWQGSENFAKYLHKGSKVQVVGKITNREWTTNEGVKRNTTEIIVSQFVFLDSAPQGVNQEKQAEKPKEVNPFEDEKEEEINVENIPF